MRHVSAIPILMFLMLIFSVDSLYAGNVQNTRFKIYEKPARNLVASTTSVSKSNESTSASPHNNTSNSPPVWTVFPFVLLLLMIATGPLFYEYFWHKNYPKIAVLLAILVIFYYIFILGNIHGPVHAAFEYFQFISLLTGLFFASGGILIHIHRKATTLANVVILLFGGFIANIIGTTGASMLLIRPFIRLNKNRIKAYHIVFFIFLISNVGGSLTPIGDPPLFLGFLKGVPFFWTLKYNFIPWLLGIFFLTFIFYMLDKRNKEEIIYDDQEEEFLNNEHSLTIGGKLSFLWLLIIVSAVFIDPNVFDWVPAIHYDGQKFSFIREIIMLSMAYVSYRFADKEAHKVNDFNQEPIREVAYIFIGIFWTMMPALELVGEFAKSNTAMINVHSLYWGTGLLSGFLDNAPTYLNSLAAAMAADNADMNVFSQVHAFASGSFENSILLLKSISISAVFFGAFSYIGNGPNFMVKSIAEQNGIKMPSFFSYIVRYSIPILLPLLIATWLIFFILIP